MVKHIYAKRSMPGLNVHFDRVCLLQLVAEHDSGSSFKTYSAGGRPMFAEREP